MTAFRKVAEREVYAGQRTTVVVATFEAPDGSTFERDIVRHPGAVGVVPIVDEGTAALLVRQFRAPFGREVLEIPAGIRDVPGEPPEQTARRELEEEVGMRAGRVERLCEFYNAAGGSDEITHVYMALDLDPCDAAPQGIEEAHMTVERVSLDDVPTLIAAGSLTDAKTIIGLTLAREALQ